MNLEYPGAGATVTATITNTGSLNALVRVFYSFTINEEAKQIREEIQEFLKEHTYLATGERIAHEWDGP